MKNKNYNSNISLLRFIFCIAILLYHLNILKGGYLAVCSFFTIAGYFTTLSLKKQKTLISHYKKRVLKIYIPLIIMVSTTIIVLNLLRITIFNFKSEITSILLGYNNYFQINSNIDYFAKSINSPFIHLWYISILLQIELVFPVIFNIIKKISNKTSKYLPFIFILLLSIISTICFFYNSKNSTTITYYDTISRLFSYLFGVAFALYKTDIKLPKCKSKKIPIGIKYLTFLIIQIILFIIVPSSSNLFVPSMIATSIITLILINYSVVLYNRSIIVTNKIICFIADISYEIYLVQYPIIYLLSNTKYSKILIILITIILTIILSIIIHISLQKKNIILKLLFIILILYSLYIYLTMINTKKEINEIKKKLTNNQEVMKKKQEKYKKKKINNEIIKKENIISDEEIMKYVTNLSIVGIGDSIMLNTIDTLYELFPNGYFDALQNRTICDGYDVLKEIKNSGIIWDILIFNLGTNGEPNRECKENLRKLAGGKEIFWLTATNPDVSETNPDLISYANEFNNIHILDWPKEANNHKEYLYSDNTHLKPEAIKPYVDFIKNGIYNYYLNNKDKIIN